MLKNRWYGLRFFSQIHVILQAKFHSSIPVLEVLEHTPLRKSAQSIIYRRKIYIIEDHLIFFMRNIFTDPAEMISLVLLVFWGVS